MALNVFSSKICPYSRICYYLKPRDYQKFCSFANYTVLQSNSWKKNVHKFPNEVSLKRFFWESFPYWSLTDLYERDKLSRDSHELIYRYPIFYYAFYGQLGSMTVLSIQLYYTAVMAYCSYKGIPFSLAPTFGRYIVQFDIVSLFILSLFTLQNISIFKMAQNCPLRIYYNEEENMYLYIFLGVNPFTVRHVYCKPGDLTDLGRTALGMLFGNFKLKDYRIQIQPENFKSNEHFNRMLGVIP